jgi:hypothetical protein
MDRFCMLPPSRESDGQRRLGGEVPCRFVASARHLPAPDLAQPTRSGGRKVCRVPDAPSSNRLRGAECGSLPLGFAFAAIGRTGTDHQWLAVLLSALVPPLLWLGSGRG